MIARLSLRFAVLFYLAAILLVPVGLVFWRTFEHGVGPAWDAVTTPDALHAFWLTLEIAAIAVPLNTIFGILCALAIVRHRFPGKGVLNAVVDLPLALSPVVIESQTAPTPGSKVRYSTTPIGTSSSTAR